MKNKIQKLVMIGLTITSLMSQMGCGLIYDSTCYTTATFDEPVITEIDVSNSISWSPEDDTYFDEDYNGYTEASAVINFGGASFETATIIAIDGGEPSINHVTYNYNEVLPNIDGEKQWNGIIVLNPKVLTAGKIQYQFDVDFVSDNEHIKFEGMVDAQISQSCHVDD